MSEILDRVENRGIEKGRQEGKTEGEDNLALLSQKLFSQGRIEDVRRACEDKEFRAQLKKEFGIS